MLSLFHIDTISYVVAASVSNVNTSTTKKARKIVASAVATSALETLAEITECVGFLPAPQIQHAAGATAESPVTKLVPPKNRKSKTSKKDSLNLKPIGHPDYPVNCFSVTIAKSGGDDSVVTIRYY